MRIEGTNVLFGRQQVGEKLASQSGLDKIFSNDLRQHGALYLPKNRSASLDIYAPRKS